jgi:hypothetical protein
MQYNTTDLHTILYVVRISPQLQMVADLTKQKQRFVLLSSLVLRVRCHIHKSSGFVYSRYKQTNSVALSPQANYTD